MLQKILIKIFGVFLGVKEFAIWMGFIAFGVVIVAVMTVATIYLDIPYASIVFLVLVTGSIIGLKIKEKTYDRRYQEIEP
jgi:hypothetical protein